MAESTWILISTLIEISHQQRLNLESAIGILTNIKGVEKENFQYVKMNSIGLCIMVDIRFNSFIPSCFCDWDQEQTIGNSFWQILYKSFLVCFPPCDNISEVKETD